MTQDERTASVEPRLLRGASEPDVELVDRFLRGREEEAFRALYRAHTPGLYLFCLRFLGHADQDAEDAVQETWIRAVDRLAGFRRESSLRTWLCGIAVNCCRELRRRRPATAGPASIGPGSVPPRTATSIHLESLVRALPDGCREVLLMHDIEGYTHEEISELLGISAGTSKSQLFHARRRLRERWEGLEETP